MARPRGRRAQAAQAAQAADAPDDFLRNTEPSIFEQLSVEELRRYRKHYNLGVKSPSTLKGYMLNGKDGNKTWSQRHLKRSSHFEVARVVQQHFAEETLRETKSIVDFVYSVQNKDKAFKLSFK